MDGAERKRIVVVISGRVRWLCPATYNGDFALAIERIDADRDGDPFVFVCFAIHRTSRLSISLSRRRVRWLIGLHVAKSIQRSVTLLDRFFELARQPALSRPLFLPGLSPEIFRHKTSLRRRGRRLIGGPERDGPLGDERLLAWLQVTPTPCEPRPPDGLDTKALWRLAHDENWLFRSPFPAVEV